jgi:succinate-acetate transporter protein
VWRCGRCYAGASLGMAMAVGGIGGLIGSLVATRLGAAFGTVRVVIAARAGFLIVSITLAVSRFRTARIDDATAPRK